MGQIWHKRVAAAILNSSGELLVGKKIWRREQTWQCAGGAMEDNGETPLQAATRCTLDQLGLTSTQIIPISVMTDMEAVQCRVAHDEGSVGAMVYWALFRCADAHGDRQASAVCSLSGQSPFSVVSWQALENIAGTGSLSSSCRSMVLAVLQRWLVPHIHAYHKAITCVDFSGRWIRQQPRGSQRRHLVAALRARGHTAASAEKHLAAPYVLQYEREGSPGVWTVTAYTDDGVTPRRVLTYPLGDWEELHGINSTIFGEEPGVVPRRTVWLPEADADGADDSDYTSGVDSQLESDKQDTQSQVSLVSLEAAEVLGCGAEWCESRAGTLNPRQLAHVTTSMTTAGTEETSRYLYGGGRYMVLRRRFVAHTTAAIPYVSEEIFERAE